MRPGSSPCLPARSRRCSGRPDARAAAIELCRRADVVIENFRPGVAERLGIGPAELLIVLAIVIVLFGAGRIAGLGGALGSSIRSFRRELKEPDKEERSDEPSEQPDRG